MQRAPPSERLVRMLDIDIRCFACRHGWADESAIRLMREGMRLEGSAAHHESAPSSFMATNTEVSSCNTTVLLCFRNARSHVTSPSFETEVTVSETLSISMCFLTRSFPIDQHVFF